VPTNQNIEGEEEEGEFTMNLNQITAIEIN
jgi:hypothetical protein